jgi:hypothetical protein
MKNLKAGFAIAVLITCAVLLFLQHQAQEKLRADNEALTQQIAQLKTDNGNLSNLAAQAKSPQSLPNDQFNELLKLRGEVGVLRTQLAEKKTQSSQTAAFSRDSIKSVAHQPGVYISMDQLAFVGYATPEAALETFKWAMIRGTLEQVNDTAMPEMQDKTITSKDRDDFEKKRAQVVTAVKGFQIIAKKVLADDKVELKVKDDYDLETMKKLTTNLPPEYMVQPMVRVGNEWKLGSSTRGYQNGWENDGQIQTFVP